MMIHQGSWWDIKSVRREGREKGEPPDGGGARLGQGGNNKSNNKIHLCGSYILWNTLYIESYIFFFI